MKIESIRALGDPAKMSSWAFVEIRCDNGLAGIGMTSAPASAIHALVTCPSSGMARLLLGEDPRDVNRLTRRITAQWQAERGRGGEGGLCVNAAAALEQALWDLLGKASGQPLHRLFGGSQSSRVQVYASGSAFNEHLYERERRLVPRTAEELVSMAKTYVREGFQAFKFGWGNHYSERELETLRAVREAVGPDIKVMVDFGCPAYLDPRWTVKDAIRVSHRLGEVGLHFWEEPLPPRDFKGYAALTQASPIRIATGESLTQVDDFLRLIELKAADIVQPDVIQLGVAAFWEVAQAARSAGIECVPHGPWGAPAVSAHVQLLGCVFPQPLVEYPAQFSYPSKSRRDAVLEHTHRRLFTQPLRFEQGAVLMPESPGLGLGDWAPGGVASLEAALEEK